MHTVFSEVVSFKRLGVAHASANSCSGTYTDPFDASIALPQSNIIDVIEKGPDAAPILSSYEDAVKTYALTWQIRKASEQSAKKPV